MSGTIQPGQTISYTAAEAGDVALAIKDAATTPGHYYFTVSSATPEGSSSGSGFIPIPNPLSSSSSGSGAGSGTTTTPPAPSTNTHVGVAAPPPPTFTGTDMTTGQALAGYDSSFAETTSDSLAISTSVSDAFIISGYGNDILTASGGGTNVLDDTGGAVNFEIGSTAGKNAFFLDAGQTLVTWNTLANIHSGDFAVIYGIGPQNLIDTAQDGLGVTGYTGLTLETSQNSGASFVTLAGFSKADLSDGKLATAFGTDPSGKSFLLVAAA